MFPNSPKLPPDRRLPIDTLVDAGIDDKEVVFWFSYPLRKTLLLDMLGITAAAWNHVFCKIEFVEIAPKVFVEPLE